MKIMKLSYKSRISEVDSITGQIEGAYKEVDLENDMNLTIVMGNMSTTRSALQAAIQQTNVKSPMMKHDAVRDSAHRAVGHIIIGASYNPEAYIKESGKVLLKIFNKYGFSVVDMSFDQESSHISNFLGELRSDGVQEHIANIEGLSTAIDELNRGQNFFNQAITDWKIGKGADGAKINASEVKKALVEHVNDKLVPYLNAMVSVNSELYTPFVQSVSEIMADHNENIKRRTN